MARFCPNCGTPLNEGTKFCPNCGAATAAPAGQNTTQYTAPVYGAPVYAGNGAVRQGIPAPGYSDRVDHPEILAALRKNRRAAGVFAFILVPLPVIGLVVYSLVSEKMELAQAALFGGIISAVFLVFALYGFIRERAKNTYEATVIDKKTREVYRRGNSDTDERITEYTTLVRTAEGKKKKIVEREGSQIWAFDYLEIGERFKYHPQFRFPYEKYDKSRAPYIPCVSCGTKNPVEADRCKKCRLPLLK